MANALELMDRSQLQEMGLQIGESEWEQFKALATSSEAVEQIIPADIMPDKLWSNLSISCMFYRASRDAVSRMKPLIGRMLVVMQKYPELYKSRGFATFDAWMSDGMQQYFDINRSEAYNLKSIAIALPNVDPQTCAEIGTQKLQILVAGGIGQATDANRQRFLESAKTMTADQVREMVVTANQLEPGALDIRTVVLVLNKPTAQRLDEFMKNPKIHAFCGTESQTGIITSLLDECEGEWLAQANAMGG